MKTGLLVLPGPVAASTLGELLICSQPLFCQKEQRDESDNPALGSISTTKSKPQSGLGWKEP